MTDNSLAARVAAARKLVEGCVRDAADDDLPASVRANMQEALEFLMKLDETLEEPGGGPPGSCPSLSSGGDGGEDDRSAHWEAHPDDGVDGVLFRPDGGEALGAWITVERQDIESLDDWR